jgi:hypothetical protein
MMTMTMTTIAIEKRKSSATSGRGLGGGGGGGGGMAESKVGKDWRVKRGKREKRRKKSIAVLPSRHNAAPICGSHPE